ncbi:5'-3' exonuclease [Cytobacillus sp. IB215665]|uniref:5'-3' exonuclease n=1 Tax=Cytobacillus sp. IB215665 TaxID=3097357 RepID=UPI002A123140|nr:5'-3' exonuclease [Cytobacillus sp. IB215665]MDX8367063.1 5'-3' exonuclease [Cytobacillus sp. IB215665]
MENHSLLLIDGFNILSRCYFATSYGRDEDQLAKNSQGLYINALRVKFNKIFALIEDLRATHVAIVWDVKRDEVIRRDMFEDYKATRGELPDPLIQQFETSKIILDKIGISQISVDRYEADDVIGALATKWSREHQKQCYIYSNDRDLLQLLDPNISQVIAIKSKGDTIYRLQDFHNEYEISPNQWVDVKALLGDKSDNIPGVTGVGEKAALPLVKMYEGIDKLYEQIDGLDKSFNRYKKKLIAGKEMAFLSKKLAEIIVDIPQINEFDISELLLQLEEEMIHEEFEKYGLKAKVKR